MSEVLRFPSGGRRRRTRGAGPDRADEVGRGSTSPARHEPRLGTVLGEVLRDERHRQGRTLADVADRAAVSLPYLSEVERGRKEVSSELLGSICRALELPLADALERSAAAVRRLERPAIRAQRPAGPQLLAA